MRLVQGWGVNDIGSIPKTGFIRVAYRCWSRVLERSHSKAWKNKYPTYKDVTCCEDWKYFSVFMDWMETQPWEGNELDKDLLGDGSLYSPQTCVFIPPEINKALAANKKQGEFLSGVWFQTKSKTMVNSLKRPWAVKAHRQGSKKPVYLGNYYSEQEAHNVWLTTRAEDMLWWCDQWENNEKYNKSWKPVFKEAFNKKAEAYRGRIKNVIHCH